MAWMADHWIERTDRNIAAGELTEVLDGLDEINIADLDEDDVEDVASAMDELERLERINASEDDLIAFAFEYFSEERNPGNPGNWEGFDIKDVSDAPVFHREIADIMDEISNDKVSDKMAAAAPRSHAKSTYLSKAFPLREIVFRKRSYIIIISETPTVAAGNLEWIASQLKYNEKLRRDFGPLLSLKPHENIRDNSSEFIAWESTESSVPNQLCRVESASTGQALRGRNWLGKRPDLIICDDLEDIKSNASTPEQRQKMRDWFSQTVMPLGDPKGKRTAFVYMGTTVHHEALLVNVLYDRADFRSKVYRAIIEWPERMDLWEQCRLIYTDRERADRAEDARQFYAENREEMDRGAIVLWPEAQPIWKLMTWKWDNGSKAFNTEYMNNPVDEESMIFSPDSFTYWDGGNLSEVLRQYPRPTGEFDVYLGIDFAMGKQRGDYSAIVALARHKRTGIKYVIDVFLERIKPDAFIERIVETVLRYEPEGIAVETQAAQEFFADELKKALRAVAYPTTTRIREIKQRQRKELRIEAMLPDIESGAIVFSARHKLLLEQFEMFPAATHDDGPDALEMANSIAKHARKQIRNKPRSM